MMKGVAEWELIPGFKELILIVITIQCIRIFDYLIVLIAPLL
jgi:hypothetical protein